MGRRLRALFFASSFALGMTACGPKGGPQRGGPPPLAVDVAMAQRSDIATYVALDGQVAPLQESTLSTPQSGVVTAVYVNEGQRVSRGQVVAKLDDATLRAQLAQNQAIVAQATAKLGSSTLQRPIASAQSQSSLAGAQQQMMAAKNSVISAQAALDSATLTFKSDKSLLAQGYVSQTQFEQARSAYVAAQQGLSNAKESQLQSEYVLKSAQQGLTQPQIVSEQINSDRGSLDQARASVLLLQTQIAQTSIVAPFDGVITARLLDPGAFAAPSSPVVRVSQIDTVYVNVNVPDDNLAYIHPGTEVTFTTSSAPGKTFSGTVFDINATPTQGTLSYRARIKYPNPGQALRGGMLVSVNVRKEMHKNAIVVPRTAVFQTDQGANVFTVVDPPAPPAAAGGGGPPAAGAGAPKGAGGPAAAPVVIKAAKVVAVKLGLQTDTLAEVQSVDITPGTLVITTRPDALQDKSLVAISAGPPGGRTGGRKSPGRSAQ